ncbi:MAG TPA: hypothetical protein VMU67_13940 [Steroidobacteraceae bacterium]|nr:hypothetical protein [Steroidobacteraceae bacterium]
MPAKIPAVEAPHSWAISSWPEHVYPNSVARARWLIRAHKRELFNAGVLARPGREIIVFGRAYCAWLARKKARVAAFDIGAARSREAVAE